MHISVPKPLHGWRQFTGEVGIIVIGVLIALAALMDDQLDRVQIRLAEFSERKLDPSVIPPYLPRP